MTITRNDFDNINEQDVQELLEGQVPEGIYLEYKRDLYGNSDANKKEFLKDISAFANTHGGHLLIGVEEIQGIPTNFVGVGNIDLDAELQRLEAIIRTGLEPKVIGIRIGSVQIHGGNDLIIIRVPPSWSLPHRVCRQSHNKVYLRNSTGVHEASMDELRNLFISSATMETELKSFQNERLSLIDSGNGPFTPVGTGRLIMHIIPFSAFRLTDKLNVQEIHEQRRSFYPLGVDYTDSRYNLDGLINYRRSDVVHGYTQIFRNGAVESVKFDIVRVHDNGDHSIPAVPIHRDVLNAIPNYLSGLNNLGISPPLAIMITIQDVDGATLPWRHQNIFDEPYTPFDKYEVRLPEIIIDEYGDDQHYQRKLRPAYDVLWNAIGEAKSQYFDESDLYTGVG